MIKNNFANVYNFYRDLLYHFSNHINSKLGYPCQKIETTFMDRTFLLKDYNAELKLPAMLVSFTNLMPYVEKMNPYMTRLGFNNVFSSVLLINETKNESIITNNSYFNMNISITINTSSQYEAAEISTFASQIFPQNITYQWEGFNTLIPIHPDLISSWDLTYDEIYYLYQNIDPNLGVNLYYGLYPVSMLVTSQGTSFNINNQQTNQSVNLNFELKVYVPTSLINLNLPGIIERIQISNLFYNSQEPIVISIIDEVTTDTDFTYNFYRSYIISSTNLSNYDDKYMYITIELNDYLKQYAPDNLMFGFQNIDNILYQYLNQLSIDSYDESTNIITLKIPLPNNFNDFLNNYITYVVLVYTKR